MQVPVGKNAEEVGVDAEDYGATAERQCVEEGLEKAQCAAFDNAHGEVRLVGTGGCVQRGTSAVLQ